MSSPTLDVMWGDDSIHIIITGWPTAPRLTIGGKEILFEEGAIGSYRGIGDLVTNTPGRGTQCWWGEAPVAPDATGVEMTIAVADQKPIRAVALRPARPAKELEPVPLPEVDAGDWVRFDTYQDGDAYIERVVAGHMTELRQRAATENDHLLESMLPRMETALRAKLRARFDEVWARHQRDLGGLI